MHEEIFKKLEGVAKNIVGQELAKLGYRDIKSVRCVALKEPIPGFAVNGTIDSKEFVLRIDEPLKYRGSVINVMFSLVGRFTPSGRTLVVDHKRDEEIEQDCIKAIISCIESWAKKPREHTGR